MAKAGPAPQLTKPDAARSGYALPESERKFFEPSFGADFSHVKIHFDARAASAAAALQARAFTLGHDIVFGAGEYAPHEQKGRHLLAHELAHVVQQSNGPARLQRRLLVEDPSAALPGTPARENWEEIRDYVRALSSGFDVTSSGDITPTGTTCDSPVRQTDQCLCDLHASTDDWKVKIDDLDWPHTEEANHRVTVHSTRSPVAFGAWGGGADAGKRIEQGHPRVLGHELCGHAWLMHRGVHPTGPAPVFVGGRLMGRPSHDPTIAVENTVAQEMTAGAPTRGSFADPHHGESFARITVSGYATGATDPSALSADMQARLARVHDVMVASSLLHADVVGHADPSGSAAANTSVSRQRARRVRDFLVSAGVPTSRFLAVEGHGTTECPPAPTDNPACRKVDVFMFNFQGSSLRNP